VSLPIPLDYAPMEADSVLEMPAGPDWQYEPKWDGFRSLCFRDGESVEIRSKAGQDLARYFPEMIEALGGLGAKKFVLDGELVVPVDGKLAFDALLQRIHPAASRVRKLSIETPSRLIVFDLLVDDRGKSLIDLPLRERRAALEAFAAQYLPGNPSIHLSPATPDIEEARRWFHEMSGGLDEIFAKRLDLPYQTGTRKCMQKIKNLRTEDCVVGGFRYGQKTKVVGSLLLGLYDEAGLLHHVGFTSGIAAAEKKRLTAMLEKEIQPPGFTGNAPGGPSRWSTERSTEWQPLRPHFVVEVQYDHFTGGRFRHGTRLLRWRPDKKPEQCRMSQVERDTRSPLDLL
jgi:ATP-dependent DNA ligase